MARPVDPDSYRESRSFADKGTRPHFDYAQYEKTKFFLYARKSSEPEEKQAMSIEAQIAELTEFARRENIKITETFTESKSAKTPGRTVFNQMIEKIHASKEPVAILAWHPDRLARNSVDGGQIIYLVDIEKICALRFPTFWFTHSLMTFNGVREC